MISMRKYSVPAIVLVSITAIIAVIIAEHRSGLPGRRPANPYAYDVDEFRSVDTELVRWRETRQVELDIANPRAIAYAGGKFYLAAENELHVIGNDWERLLRATLPGTPTFLTAGDDGRILVGLGTYMVMACSNGEIFVQSEPVRTGSYLTSAAFYDGNIYVADAAARKVRIFNQRLEQTGEFSGDSGVSDIHGFIVPGGHFSLAVNSENELWITNPGIHSLQNYTAAGRLRSDIRRSSFDIEGFSGCCNPVHFTFLPEGGFLTSEKGIIRIKVLKESGDLESVVAPPEKFTGGLRAPAVAVDDEGRVLVLDFDRNMIRIFEPI